MGKIDNSFSRHDIISYLRKEYKLSRGSRKIPNPFKEFNRTNPDYTIIMIDGKLQKRLKTKSIESENGTIYITDSMGNTEKFRKKIIEDQAKKMGVDPSQIDLRIEIEEDSSTDAIVHTPNNPLIMEAAKISYEVACEKLVCYLDDDLGKRYASMLKNGDIDNDLLTQTLINYHVGSINYVYEKLHLEKSHVALIGSHPEIGLVASVSFFAPIYPLTFSFILSTDKVCYKNLEPIILTNSYANKKYRFPEIPTKN